MGNHRNNLVGINAVLWAIYTTLIVFGHVMFDLSIWEQFGFLTGVGISLNQVHVLGHIGKWRTWTHAHLIGHHVGAYPAAQFSSGEYRVNPYDPYGLNGVLYVIMSGVWIFGIGLLLLHWTANQIFYWTAITILFLHTENKLHHEVHLSSSGPERNLWLHNQQWFQTLAYFHRLHHKGRMRRNYAVLTIWTDQLLGTFCDVDDSNFVRFRAERNF